MEIKEAKNYLRIETEDGRYFIWVKRPDKEKKRSYLFFNLGGKAEMADAVDGLGYLTVEWISQIDDEMCSVVFRFKEDTARCMGRLIDDLPDIMHRILSKQPKSESHDQS